MIQATGRGNATTAGGNGNNRPRTVPTSVSRVPGNTAWRRLFIGLAVWAAVFTATNLAAASPGSEAVELLLKHGVQEIVFAERDEGRDGHWYANFGYYDRGKSNVAFGRKGRLRRLTLGTGQIEDLVTDLQGTVRDPQVHHDGRKVLFSYRAGGRMPFHLYEINVDGSGLRQLTDGIYDDMEPAYLPDGGIVFVSSRCRKWVPCWFTQVATLHRCDGDGANVQPLSANVEQDNTPWVLPDGRILFTRWEYVDRSQMKFHHLWTCNPDGSNPAVFFGNMNPGDVYIDAKPIADSGNVALIVSPGHGRPEHKGNLAVLDPRRGPDDKKQLRVFGEQTKDFRQGYRDIYPVAPDVFLAARERRLMVVLKDGTEHVLLESETPVHEPRPIAQRPRERIIPSRVNLQETTGTLVLQNVYEGRNLKAVRPGEIQRLLVLEQLPKPINYNGKHNLIPISWGGSFFINRILGWVPVEADGSAYFKIPANRPIFLVATDERNSSVKRMHSFLSVRPGETTGCIGCHENRTQASRLGLGQTLQALRRSASEIQPLPNNPYVFDYVRDIQPILDRHCVGCHNPDRPNARVILTGDNGIVFNQSFFHLTGRQLVVDGRNQNGNTAPRAVGDSASPLMALLQGGHQGVKLAGGEIETIRNWINASAFFVGTYAALGNGILEKISDRNIDVAEKKATEAIQRRCLGCHENQFMERANYANGNMNVLFRSETISNPRQPRPPEPFYNVNALWNLSRPEKSTMLLAPLAKTAGGWASEKALAIVPVKERGKPTAASKCPVVFESTSDPDYQILLDFGRACQAYLQTDPRWYMPGFKPHEYYVREMIRYGILPETFKVGQDPFDAYAVDRKYFESLWHYPTGSGPRLFENPGMRDYYMREK